MLGFKDQLRRCSGLLVSTQLGSHRRTVVSSLFGVRRFGMQSLVLLQLRAQQFKCRRPSFSRISCSFAVAESLPDVVVTISSLCFLLPQSITSDKLFAVTGGSLQVTSCSFSPKGDYPFSFQLICGSAHQVTLESTNVSSASLSSVALISTSCSVSMSNCRFSSIVVLEGHGSVLRADASNTARVSVLNTVLSGCSSSGVGSAILCRN
ncbi:hypothetical protein BLNAU_24388 [Blattamonas nauphoetae]|uniref:Uncharacterized protein n=1 Tax=Blattamonas nauphoetae TaxID=2049346 RepID=A0ABQ9WML1_9EUKA|nr:hypothetical protein BLNAU_24388 [Blattamonas nauphoetae]